MTTKAIEAGARAALRILNSEIERLRPNDAAARTLASAVKHLELHLAALASGALVPAAQLAAERERCAAAAESVGQPVGAGDGCGTYVPGTSADAARAIRSLSPEPASGEVVVVPRVPTEAMLEKGAMEVAMNCQRGATAEEKASYVYRAMLNGGMK